MFVELMDHQRIMDHLKLMHSYFLMLRGDLVSGIIDSIIQSANSSTKSSQNKTLRQKPAYFAEHHLGNALTALKPLPEFTDLLQYLHPHVVKVVAGSSSSSKPFEDLIRMRYSPQEPVRSILRDSLKSYVRLFDIICPLQILYYNLDSMALRLRHSSKLFNRKKDDRMIMLPLYMNISKARIELLDLLNLIFEQVLKSGSEHVLGTLKKETDVYQFITNHEKLLMNINKQLYVRKSDKEQREKIIRCKLVVRNLLKSVEVRINTIERAEFSPINPLSE